MTGTKTGDFAVSPVTVLPNGNYVVSMRTWDNGAAIDAGAVTFCSKATGVSGPVSASNSLVGGTTNDEVGNGLVVLPNSNYVVQSPRWANGPILGAGAVTFGSGTTGISGPVSAANSLVGTRADDYIGDFFSSGVLVLSNGNYVVGSPGWSNGGANDAGAVTFGDGLSGISGPVTVANSLIGSAAEDYVGRRLMALATGNYVVGSSQWNRGAVTDAGAATFGSGTTGISGPITTANSLIGATVGDEVGQKLTALTNGNYVVGSPLWNNGTVADAGAATFGNGASGITGPVAGANSLVGTTAGDSVGGEVTVLTNGNYVVGSRLWNNAGIADVGAATLGNGTTGILGPVTTLNSLAGTTAGDAVGNKIFALKNGNYVVASKDWDRGAMVDAGAVTFATGTDGIVGPVTANNSLVGVSAGDSVGGGFGNGYGGGKVVALANGNFVVTSPDWNNGSTVNAGAVTWASGTNGIAGPVTASNSLVGSSTNDGVGDSALALVNGNYVISSPHWNRGAIGDVGAATFGDGAMGVSGPVSVSNSLVGSTGGDRVGGGIVPLTNGNYVVDSGFWGNGTTAYAGAVTFGNGTNGISGTVTPANSLVGSRTNDQVGRTTALTNGNYVVQSTYWDNGSIANAGAVTPGDGMAGTSGPISPANSVVGTTATAGGGNQTFAFDSLNNQVVVGRRADNIVTLVRLAAPATSVTVTGLVSTPDGRGLRNATVILTGPTGTRRTVLTSSFGAYTFNEVLSGATYTVSVTSRRYRFAARQVAVNGNLSNVDFVGLE
ncbi:MAG: hypothetical protein WKF34_00175 [Pyrinomonadaceae bacterium]